MYCTNTYGDECKRPLDTFRDGFPLNASFGIEQVLYENGVDMYIGSHQHVYERFWPIYKRTVSFLRPNLCLIFYNPTFLIWRSTTVPNRRTPTLVPLFNSWLVRVNKNLAKLLKLTRSLAGCQEITPGFPPVSDPISAARSNNYGFGQIHIFNHTHLYYEQIQAAQVNLKFSSKLI